MVIADLNIICIDQPENKPYPDPAKIVCEADDRNNAHGAVYPLYDFSAAYKLRGWWYTYWPDDELFLERPFFDLVLQDGESRIQLYDTWKDQLYHLFSYYLSLSPVHRIGILIRLQDETSNAVHGPMYLQPFMEQLLAGVIHYNELYLISLNPNT